MNRFFHGDYNSNGFKKYRYFLLVLGIICAPGILLGLFEVGKKVGQTLATLLK
ncbi:hypothetical protein HO404_00710 [Streptococcus suis]|nr:hypothetical protein [Streptococcus suis]NQH97267.1 hypothetical protein [Streptococcus suis]NQM54360.1 hypothetical protein [Streptococcus suis]NQO47193.1 hypothetical protein [Streptococcus suis]WNF84503.1 hypothetical protein RJW52_00835 [Streptococcus suis]